MDASTVPIAADAAVEDWSAIIAELGMSQPQLAAACKCAQSTISALATGKTSDPRHSTGEALRVLLRRKRAERAAAAHIDTGERRRITDRAAAGGA